MNQNLRIPGPIPVPDEILEAMSRPMFNHRGLEYKELLFRVTDKLKKVFDTAGDVYILTTSGTGAMEAALVNTLSPDDRVLCVSVGAFGDRFGEIASAFGADVQMLNFPLGSAVDVDQLRQTLAKGPEFKAVLVTHNETSTGVTNDMEAIARTIREESDTLILVDGISSVCSIPFRTDAWDCDVVASASQKGWMLPPGLAFVSFSERAWRAHADAKMGRFYFDISAYKRYLEIGQPPYTPAISITLALDLALDKILSEGMGSVFERHARMGRLTRDGVGGLGLSLLADEAVASDTVTAVRVPSGIDGARLLALLREDHQVVLAGGQQALKGKIFRIGHMGYCTEEEIQDVMEALATALPKVGYAAA